MKNKGLVCGLGFLVITSLAGLACGQANVGESPQPTPYPPSQPSPSGDLVNIFLCGDVMTGRGIDQILPHAGNPFLYEPFVRSAQDYVELAERAHGPIPRPVDFAYIWGDALAEFDRLAPDVKIINLETSITQSDDYWADKGIHYRMHPENIPCLTAAGINCCALANNHVLDWGYAGLVETLETLEKANIESAGAGRNLQEAEEPAVIEVAGRGRVLVFSYGTPSSGIPLSWAASETMPGVNLLRDLSAESLQWVKRQVDKVKRESDIVVCSIHWGSNWGYEIPIEHVRFAHGLIDEAGVDVIHGHSSHHVKGIEVYKGKPILYGCGDLINDYEGIG
ncbi:MAG: CapA family protein, partial [Chloroflexi bacterium]|nr:CapA family protein [Chloroflexota bacterium]